MKRFALIGAAGYIAPRHMKAIRDSGNVLVAAMDPNDSVGVIDSYFPDADFFTEIERFDRHLDLLRRQGKGVDFISICSPNYLHDAHIRFGLKHGAHVICEKPTVLNPWNLEGLQSIEVETGKHVYNIMQLRLHSSLITLKNEIDLSTSTTHQISINYVASRGRWYQYSWKGNPEKSGGITTNIGIHFFDMLNWIFGPVTSIEVDEHTDTSAKGKLILAKGTAEWFLSIDYDHLPIAIKQQGLRSYRSIQVDGEEIAFNDLDDLHTKSYQQIIEGNGIRIHQIKSSLDIIHKIRPNRLNPPKNQEN